MARDKKAKAETNTSNAILRYVERLESLEEQKAAIGEDIKQVNGEIKADGFDTGCIKDLVKIRKKQKQWQKKLALLQTYAAAIQLDLFAGSDSDFEEPEDDREAA